MDSQIYLALQHLYKIWEAKRWDRTFYLAEMFDRVLALLSERAEANGFTLVREGSPVYRALFVPVGLSVENIALMSALFSPVHLTLAFSEKTYSAHQSYFHVIRNKIKGYCGTISETRTLLGGDQSQTEREVLKWAENIKSRYGYAMNEMAIDLTGGTKPMSIGAQSAAVSLGIPAFYLNVDYDPRTLSAIPGTEELCSMRRSQADVGTAFVIMPFKPDYNAVYAEIRESAGAAGMRCTRVDEEMFQGGIMDKIRGMLATAEIIIADLSDKNLNVYYELGLAHAWSKPVVMMTNNIDEVPFDLRHIRFVQYDFHNVGEIRDKLSREIISLR